MVYSKLVVEVVQWLKTDVFTRYYVLHSSLEKRKKEKKSRYIA